MDYSFPLTAMVLLYAPSHRQDSTYHGLCYTSRGALAGTRNSSMGPLHERSIRRPIAPWADALTTELHLAPPFNLFRTGENIGTTCTVLFRIPQFVNVVCLWSSYCSNSTNPQFRIDLGNFVKTLRQLELERLDTYTDISSKKIYLVYNYLSFKDI